MKHGIVGIVSTVIVVLVGVTAHAEVKYASMRGLWVWNPGESVWPAGHRGPGPNGAPFVDHSLEIQKDDGKVLIYSDVVTRPDGKTSIMTWTGAWDGKDYKWPNGYSMAYEHVDANTYKDRWTAPNGEAGGDSCTLSDGGRKMICHGYFQPAGGRRMEIVEVSDKVEPGSTVTENGTQYLSLQGLWVENFAECVWPNGKSPFVHHALEITKDDGSALVYSDVITRSDGESSKMTWNGGWGGVDFKWANGYAMAYKHLEPALYRDHWSAPDGRIGGDTCTLSDRGAKMKCYGYMQPAGGKWTELLEVFDRVR